MITLAAQALVVLSGLWLIAVAGLMLLRPDIARAALAKMGSTPAIQFGEHAVRFTAGLAFVLAAEASKAPDVFRIFGGFVAISSVVIVLAPRRWHARYAVFWADKLELWMIRTLTPFSAAAGAAVIWAATG